MRFGRQFRTALLAGGSLLAFSTCHLPPPSAAPGTMLSLSPAVLLPVAEFSEHSSSSAAEQLLTHLSLESGLPAPSGQPHTDTLPPRLPPLPFISQASVYAVLSPDTAPFTGHDLFPADLLTPPVPALFAEADELGWTLGLDMGLTQTSLPLDSTLHWPLAVQAFCACPQDTGLYQTTEAEARLDFSTGRFRLLAGFTTPATTLRSVGIDTQLNRDQLSTQKATQAVTELGFATQPPARLTGDLDLFLSGREARHIGGQFSAVPEMSLSDILFVMQFASDVER